MKGSTTIFVSLVGLILAALVGCTAEPPPSRNDFGDPAKEQPVAVTLRLDGAGNPVEINPPVPDPVVLSKNLKQTAHWYLCPPIDAKLEIVMKNGPKPFKIHPKSYGKHALSDPPEKEAPNTDYPYTILVTMKDGKQLRRDPIIRVAP